LASIQGFLSPTEASCHLVISERHGTHHSIDDTVFLSHYLTIWPEATSTLPQVGTVSTVSTTYVVPLSSLTQHTIKYSRLSQGIMYLFLPPLALLLAKHPQLRPASMWLGLLISTSGMLASGFTTRPWQLVVTQGFVYALGGSELAAS
jgi:hypothetical protein